MPQRDYVTVAHKVAPGGNDSFRVVDAAGTYVSMTVKRRHAAAGGAPNLIARVLAARPPVPKPSPW